MIKGLYIQSFDCYRKNIAVLLGLVALFYFTTDAISAYVDLHIIGPDDFKNSFRLTKFLDLWIFIIPDAAVVYVTLRYLSGNTVGFRETFGGGFWIYWKMWLTRFMGYLSMLTLILFIFPGIYLMIRWSLAEIAVVEDGRCGTAAFGRSWELTRGKFWQVSGVMLAGMLPLLVGLAMTFGVYWVIPEDNWILDAGLSMILSLIVPFYMIYLTVYYHQLSHELESNTTLEQK